MNKMDGMSMDLTGENVAQLKKLFPEAVTEGKIDFEVLKALLGGEIEQRQESEITTINGKRISPQKIRVYNPAFDVTPASLITGYITEKGVFSTL